MNGKVYKPALSIYKLLLLHSNTLISICITSVFSVYSPCILRVFFHDSTFYRKMIEKNTGSPTLQTSKNIYNTFIRLSVYL